MDGKHKLIRTIFISSVFLLFAATFWPFLTELILAALFAFAFHDFNEKMLVRKIKRKYASLTVTLGVLIFIASPIIFIVLKTISAVKQYSQIGFHNTQLYQSTEKLLQDLTAFLTTIVKRLDLDASRLPNPSELLSRYSGEIGSLATGNLAKIPEVGLSIFIFFLGLYYFLNESDKIKSQFIKFDLLSEIETNKIIHILKKSSYTTLAISLFIASIQALIVSTFAYFSGFTEFFIIFIITFIFSLVPMVGSAPTPLFLMIISYMQSNPGAAVTMFVAGLIAGSIDNLIKPLILSSGEESFPPILSLITLIGAILVYGAIGILIGPIITQLAIHILRILGTNMEETPSTDEKSGESTESTATP